MAESYQISLEPYSIQNYLLIFVCGSLLVWYIQFSWKRRKLYIHAAKVKGPPCLPFIGNAHMFLGNGNDIIKKLLKIQEDIPGLSKVWLGPKLVYLVSNPDHIETILNSPKALNKDDMYRFVSDFIGYGLLTSHAKKWRHHRKIIAPSFNQRILDSFIEVFSEQSVIFSELLKKYVGQKDINLYSLITNCTLDIICQTAMGVEMNIQKGDSDFGEVLDKLMEIVTYRIFRLWYHSDIVWKLSPLSRTFHRLNKKFKDTTSTVVKKKLMEHNRKHSLYQSCVYAEIDDESVKKRMAFLDLILENSDFTEEELNEEVEIFLAAGTETTASTFCCLCVMLGMHQEIQQKVYEEAMDVLGSDRAVESKDMSKFNYTERVIKETLRLFPIAAILGRTLEEDIDLGDGITLPAGSSAGFGTVHIHRDPKYWPNPFKFDPDRFLPEEVSKRHPCTYIPFSYGPRNCIGWRYALSNLKTIIATVIRRYRFHTEYKSVEEIELKINLLLRMRDGPKVWLEER
ncbi:unnamed protein product [Phaedon cochleariae]|uniref:Cytochrome P450 n=1 Tax=Phaedon cochleariae TaxID=80249 RepID=A0A9P0DHP0_PHACE|nr:unnamed protein product [Phaedon cochleariae]